MEPTEALLLQAFVGVMSPGGFIDESRRYETLVNPGVDVPPGAAEVHGLSTERVRAEGVAPTDALRTIQWALQMECVDLGKPLVIYNAPYDLTLLAAEFRRHGIPQLAWDRITVIDPLVIDKALFKYRKGSGMRKLTAVTSIYGVPLEANAHDAAADCLMAGRVAITQMSMRDPSVPAREARRLGELSGAELMARQRTWHAVQAAGLEAWFHSPKAGDRQDRTVSISREWPIRSLPSLPTPAAEEAAA